MPRVKIKAGDHSGVEAAKGFDTYAGPVVPKGVYKCKVKMWNLRINSNDDHMFTILFEINEPKTSPKKKYNGYALWQHSSLTEQNASYVNAMLDVLEIPRKAVWGNGPVVDPDGDIEDNMGVKVTKLGTRDPVGLECLVVTKPNKYKGVTSQAPASFLAIPAGYGAATEDDGDDDGSDDDDNDISAQSGGDDDGDDDGDSSDDSEDDDPDSF